MIPQELIHYSNISDLKEILPSAMGSGIDARTKNRASETLYSFYYRSTGPIEKRVLDFSTRKYTVNLPAEAKIYDLYKDQDGIYCKLKAKSLRSPINTGNVLFETYIKAVKTAGYIGFFNSNHTHDFMKNAIMVFAALPVIKNEGLND